MPCATASSVAHAAVVELPDAGEDEHVVVHREPEQDHEQEQRQPVRDSAVRGETDQRLQPLPFWNISTSTPYAAPTDSRFNRIALIGITIERNVTSNSRNARPKTKREDQRQPAC